MKTPEEVLEKNLSDISSTTFRDMQLDDEGLFNSIIKAMRDYAEALYTERIEEAGSELPDFKKLLDDFPNLNNQEQLYVKYGWEKMKQAASLVIAKEREKYRLLQESIGQLNSLVIQGVEDNKKLLQQKDKEIEELKIANKELRDKDVSRDVKEAGESLPDLNSLLNEFPGMNNHDKVIAKIIWEKMKQAASVVIAKERQQYAELQSSYAETLKLLEKYNNNSEEEILP